LPDNTNISLTASAPCFAEGTLAHLDLVRRFICFWSSLSTGSLA
jgi:hypothetical protein